MFLSTFPTVFDLWVSQRAVYGPVIKEQVFPTPRRSAGPSTGSGYIGRPVLCMNQAGQFRKGGGWEGAGKAGRGEGALCCVRWYQWYITWPLRHLGWQNLLQLLHNCITPTRLPPHAPRREAGDVWCLPPVWNLRAAIWFSSAISSLVLLPSPVTLSVLSFSACWPFLLNFFQKILQYFSLRDRLFCMAPV